MNTGPGDNDTAGITGSISGGWSLNITTAASAAATSTSLSASPSSSFTSSPGNSVTLTADVSATSTVNEGTVAFTDGGTTISGCGAVAVSSGQAQCTTTFATEGVHSLKAAYSGTSNFGASNGTASQQVDDHTTVSGSSYCNTGSIALNNPPETVADAGPYPSHIFVSGLSGAISHLTVSLKGATYSYSQDIDALLVGPTGQTFILVAAAGPNSNGAISNVTLTLDDSAATTIASTSPWGAANATVTSKPVNYGGVNETWGSPAPAGPYGNPGPTGGGTSTLGDAFNGSNPNGTWSLYLITTAAGDGTGSVGGGWCANITTNNVTTTTTTLASSNNPSFTASPANSVTLTADVSATSTVSEGTVDFTDGGTTISGCGAVAVSSGQAQCTTTFTAEGAHSLEALYSGDSNFGASTATLSQQVDDHTTVTGSSYCNAGSIGLNNPDINNPEIGAMPYPSHVFVSGFAGNLSDLTVSLKGVTYAESQDIDALLVGPTGQTFILVAAAGPNSGGALSNVTLTLEDSAGSAVPENAAWGAANASVSYKPANYGGDNETWGPPAPAGPYGNPGPFGGGTATLGGTFNGTTPDGTWSLYLITTAGGDGTGQVAGGWCVGVTTPKVDPVQTSSTPGSSTIALGGTETDSATITGETGYNPTGTVGFSVCGPLTSASGCATGGTAVGSAATLTAGTGATSTASSTTFMPQSVGTYCFSADYSGDQNYNPSSDGTSDECFTVTAASAGTSSSPVSANIPVGTANQDDVTLAGNTVAGTPGGTVTFSVCGPLTSAAGCATGGAAVGTPVTVTSGPSDSATATSADFIPTSPGTYCFRADYSGSTNYAASSDGTSDECFTATQASAPTSSTPGSATITLGQTNTDGATVTGNATAGSPTGTVTFSVCGPLTSAAGCPTGGAAVGSPVTLTPGTGNTATASSSTFTPGATGTYCFRADYSGDSNYTASSDGTGDECFTVGTASAATASTPGSSAITLGATNTDAATVTGNSTGGSPTGAVTFSVCGPLTSAAGCATGGIAVGSPVTLTPGTGNTATASSSTFTPGTPGTYCFRADYSGDSDYTASSDGTGDECFTVASASAGTSSTPGSSAITLGATNTDGATVTGNGTGGSPTGTVTFSVCGPITSAAGCATGGIAVGSAVTLTAGSGNTATASSTTFTPGNAGTYCFRADYSGDGDYTASTDGTNDECFTVAKAPAPTSSTPGSSAITLGATNTDAATVTGNGAGGTPTGTVTFSVCGPLTSAAGCATGGIAVGSAVTLTAGTGNTATASSSTFTPGSPGTYCFRADYSGDSNYTASADGAGDECFTVGKASAATHSGPGSASVSLAATNTDHVTVTGNSTGGNPTGTVSFSLCGPLAGATGCATGGTAVGSAVTLTPGAGNTATATSAATSGLLIPGTYCFRADYSGNADYSAASDGSGADECFAVALTSSTTSSSPGSGTTIVLGETNTDVATVTGNILGGVPGGSVSFSVCGPLNSASGCATGGTAVGSAVRLSAGSNDTATATSASFTASTDGIYCFRADYPGAGNYSASSDDSSSECFAVSSTGAPSGAAGASISISTPRNGAVYTRDQSVHASYACHSGSSGLAIVACMGPVANGAALSTSKTGSFSFTVTATNSAGQLITASTHYRVVLPNNHFTVSHLKGHPDGQVTLEVKVPGPGTIDMFESAWDDNLASVASLLQPAPRRFVFARKHVRVRAGSTVRITVTPNSRGKLLVEHPGYPIVLRVWVTYTPSHGVQRSIGFYGVHLARGAPG
jgi:hypothetical protein